MTRTASSATTSFTYDGSALLTETTGSTTTPYTYGNEMVRRGSLYPAYDALSDARRWDNASEAEQSAGYQDTFGNTSHQYGSAKNYQFGAAAGYRNDFDAGLLFIGARYYDPQVGRFISRDTVLTEKPYAYCNGDPVNKLDPSGHAGLGLALFGLGGRIGVVGVDILENPVNYLPPIFIHVPIIPFPIPNPPCPIGAGGYLVPPPAVEGLPRIVGGTFLVVVGFILDNLGI